MQTKLIIAVLVILVVVEGWFLFFGAPPKDKNLVVPDVLKQSAPVVDKKDGVTKEILIQVRFKVETSVGRYSDNLVLTQEEYGKLTEADIDAQIKERVTNWMNQIKNPTPATQ